MKRLIIHSTLAGLILCGFFGVLAESVAGNGEPKALLLRQRWGLGTETVNGKIYAIGGQDDLPAAGKRVAEYDLGKDQWTEKKSILTGRFRIATGMVRGKIYVFGGTANNFEALPTVEEYDPKTDTWTKKADMPTARLGPHCRCGRRENLYHWRGRIVLLSSGAVEVYDPVSDTWEKKADMPNPRWGISAVAVASRIYVFGGAVDNTHQKYTDLTEEYDPKTDTWTKKADMPIKFFDMAASFVNSGKAYIIGGKTFNGRDKDGPKGEGWILHWTVLEYDVEKNKWQRLNDEMPTGRGTLASSVVDGKIYAIGGHHNGPRREVEVYTPDGWPFPKAFSVSPQGKLATKWGEN